MAEAAVADPINRPIKRPAAFIQKLYTLIDECDVELATWMQGGRMFIIKDPDSFAQTKIPLCFGHNKFPSFARQLNFYGFRKVSTKPIKNGDLDEAALNHVVFYNPSFIKGRLDLLPDIQRKTRCRGSSRASVEEEEEEEIQDLKQKVRDLKKLIGLLQSDFESQCALIREKYQRQATSLMDQLSAIESSKLIMDQLSAFDSSKQHDSNISNDARYHRSSSYPSENSTGDSRWKT